MKGSVVWSKFIVLSIVNLFQCVSSVFVYIYIYIYIYTHGHAACCIASNHLMTANNEL
jgi:hypothetical protein